MTQSVTTMLGIDVGGTKIAAGIVNFPEGRILSHRTIRTTPERGSDCVLADVAAQAELLSEDAGRLGLSLDGIGLGLCELIGPDGEILSANCLRWTKSEVQNRLRHIAPVSLEADVRAAARAEAEFGAGRAYRIFLYVTVGTGISSCLMVDGEPYMGARGLTGTAASSPLSLPCESCENARQPSFEQVASGPALVARYNESASGTVSTAQQLIAAAANGDSKAVEIIQSGGESLGSLVGWLVNVFDPEAVILGGGLGLSEGHYWDCFVVSARRHIWSEVHRDLPLIRAASGPQAGLLGAALFAWKRAGTIAP